VSGKLYRDKIQKSGSRKAYFTGIILELILILYTTTMTLTKKTSRFICLVFMSLLANTAPVLAQDTKPATAKEANAEKNAAYTRSITQRADKIVKTLNLADEAKTTKVRDIIVQQYRDLNEIHSERDAQVKAAKAKAGDDKQVAEAQVKKIEDKALARLNKLHTKYLAKLAGQLSAAQVDQVKDGMTYGVLPNTYNGYLAMLPDLTETQKAFIRASLVEAREKAMDAESSEKKHGWFGKYKGRINNYLSAAGYDLKKAGEDWDKRLKAEAAAKAK
jgi:Spy/CpxP family protein refolding chaperone